MQGLPASFLSSACMAFMWRVYVHHSLSAVGEEPVSQPVCFPAVYRCACFGTEHTHNGSLSRVPSCNTAVPSVGGSRDNRKDKH